MTEPAWKVVMDGDGVTISGDGFSLTTNSSEQGTLDSVVTALQGVARASYGQYCGLSRAIEAVGERWGMLIIRDLLTNPKSTAELHEGLRGVPVNLLSMRIKEMAFCGVLEKSGTTDVDGGDQYQLTKYGRRLEEILLAFGRWGSAMLAEPRPEDIITEDSIMIAMRASYLADAAVGRSASYELRFGDIVLHIAIEEGQLEVGRGPLPGAPVIEPGPTLKDLLTGVMTVEEAFATGTVHVTGGPDVLRSFLTFFGLPYQPVPERSAV
jgi:DNA-binding HxlR family transcriptional regulator